MFIKDIIDNSNEVTLITRPRRFGKTINMTMLNSFLDITVDSKSKFEGLNIMKQGDMYTSKINSAPVLYISFSEFDTTTLENIIEKLKTTFMKLYQKYIFLLDKDILHIGEIEMFENILTRSADINNLTEALKNLSEYLYRFYGKRVYILIDEYDVPLQKAYAYETQYYKEILPFFKNLYVSTFKNNSYLEKAVLTGVSRIAKESIFSGANNFEVFSVLTDGFNEDFGITKNEINRLLTEYGFESKETEIKDWYNGYRIGQKVDVYNPWSILNFLKTGQLEPYWLNTSSNDLIKMITTRSVSVKQKLETLLLGESIEVKINEDTILDNIENKEENIWGLFVSTGYLKIVEKIDINIYMVAIPNNEIRMLFEDIVLNWFSNIQGSYDMLNSTLKFMLQLNKVEFSKSFKRIVLEIFSYMDVQKNMSENFYHGFVLGMLINLKDTYYISSNKESGMGRYDICVEPKDNKDDAAFIMEFKIFEDGEEKDLQGTLNNAMTQIENKEYESNLRQRGFTNIHKIAFAFNKKQVEIRFD